MRTFIAVRIVATSSISDALRDLASMRPAVRPIAEDQLHVTLKFLGETTESQVPDLMAITAEAAREEGARELKLKGMGAFPNIDRPSVVWIGFDDPQPLPRLADKLAECCLRIGFERESRPFHAHLTVARVKSDPPRRLAKYLREEAQAQFGSTVVSALELFRSDLGHGRPSYTSLVSVPLLPIESE